MSVTYAVKITYIARGRVTYAVTCKAGFLLTAYILPAFLAQRFLHA